LKNNSTGRKSYSRLYTCCQENFIVQQINKGKRGIGFALNVTRQSLS
jgi:hypothetical protein